VSTPLEGNPYEAFMDNLSTIKKQTSLRALRSYPAQTSDLPLGKSNGVLLESTRRTLQADQMIYKPGSKRRRR
jgi:hypothetical protein